MLKRPAAWHCAALFFFLGLFTCTWDKILSQDVFQFTFRINQLCFFLSFLSISFARRKESVFDLVKPLKQPFSLFILALVAFYWATSPISYFPQKSFLYAGWILFNLITVWISAAWLAPFVSKKKFAYFAWATALFHAVIILIDHIAYMYGYSGGLVGFNQDSILRWGVSRPHAFSFEPSYIAAFLTFGAIASYGLFYSISAKSKWLVFCSFFLIIFSTLATTSRTGWLALGVGSFLFFGSTLFSERKFSWGRFLTVLALAASAISAFMISVPERQRQGLKSNLVSGIYSGTDGSSNARLTAFIYAWQMAKDTNWLGTGLGASYKYWITTQNTPQIADEKPFSEASYGNEVVMSTWGQLLAEGGITAVILYAAAAFALLLSLWREWRRTCNRLILSALISAIIFFIFVAFFLGNVARGDVWVWFAIWSRMALPDAGEEAGVQRA